MKRLLVTDASLARHPAVGDWSTDTIRPDQTLLRTHGLRPHDPPWPALHWLSVAEEVEPWFESSLLVGVFRTELG